MWLDFRRAHFLHAPDGKGLMLGSFLGVSFVVIVSVITEQTNIYRGQQGEDKGLDEADQ